MATVVTTFSRRFRSFSRLRVCLSVLSSVLLITAGSFAQTAGASGCQPDEGVFFSCRLKGNNRIVSFCTASKAAPFGAITYRYGTGTKVELTYAASAENDNRFLGTVSPVGPKASVRQVWFDLKGIKYIATSCVGGDCTHRGGLIVFQGKHLLTSAACANESGSHPWFTSKVVYFGSDIDSSHSNTNLIQLQAVDNNVDVLYPSKRVN
jgi:hypothetical protein